MYFLLGVLIGFLIGYWLAKEDYFDDRDLD